ncbi:hypothetical protein A2Y83_03480 [Candidatus Falkowbacteria bacterium RBG_13_39_14]|uniref:PIN domain-containing protein n=1 Tax=Candidatus Falkowbacteria bacterium RBG_13_39_14 TaxID=1797985 RepID=A0A1F5S4R5_9BACT|nr:MAG: hypothetical protein A2Y83_03480 [Candidatus Falkowbacteria bacterium RBG_13_39_14]
MGEYKYFLDTNIFLRFLIQDEISKVAECQKLFEFIESGEIKAITSSLVLAELTWTGLSFYKIKKNAMVDILRACK